MGRSVTPKYVLKIETYLSRIGRVSSTPCAWRKEYGRPTPENIDKYVTKFEESCKPGGCNAHLGIDPVISAEIRYNPGAVVASWDRKTFRPNEPMFQVI